MGGKGPEPVRRVEGGGLTTPRTNVYEDGWVHGTRLRNNELAETARRTMADLQLPL